jgi:hypothetical protein
MTWILDPFSSAAPRRQTEGISASALRPRLNRFISNRTCWASARATSTCRASARGAPTEVSLRRVPRAARARGGALAQARGARNPWAGGRRARRRLGAVVAMERRARDRNLRVGDPARLVSLQTVLRPSGRCYEGAATFTTGSRMRRTPISSSRPATASILRDASESGSVTRIGAPTSLPSRNAGTSGI